MRYLVIKTNKKRKAFFWQEETKTHTLFAKEKNIDLEQISSVGYILYNPKTKKWILDGAMSWTGNTNVENDNKYIRNYIKKHFETDILLKERLTDLWYLTQRQNEEIIKSNPLLAALLKRQGKERE